MPVPEGTEVDFPAVMERTRRLRARISHHDSAKRFREMGVDVFLGEGRFSDHNTVEAAGKTLHFKKAVIATGARAVHPPIEGLADAGFLTTVKFVLKSVCSSAIDCASKTAMNCLTTNQS